MSVNSLCDPDLDPPPPWFVTYITLFSATNAEFVLLIFYKLLNFKVNVHHYGLFYVFCCIEVGGGGGKRGYNIKFFKKK